MGCAAILASFALAVGQGEPSFPEKPVGLQALEGVRGQQYSLKDFKLSVIVFISTDCPIANRFAPEIMRISKEYRPQGVAVFTIYVEQQVSIDAIAKHRTSFKLNCPAAVDPGHKLARLLGATVTPQAAVLNSDSKVVYRGRIDDSWTGHGQPKTTTVTPDLRNALNEYLEGKPITRRETPAIGCSISGLTR